MDITENEVDSNRHEKSGHDRGQKVNSSDDRTLKTVPTELSDVGGVVGDPCKEGAQWYVIRSKSRFEAVCLDELSKAGFEALCPMRMDYRWRRRRQEAVPLFPGYLFSRFSYEDDYHKVRWLRGVLHLVQFGEAPPPAVNDEIMRFFAENMNDDGVIETSPELVEGDRVEFLTESMRGLVGTVLRIDSAEQRVHVLMDLLYQATVKVPVSQLQAL
jgi:transcriptional antiterminator RfaH